MKLTHLPITLAVVLTLSLVGALAAQAGPQNYSILTGAQEEMSIDQDLSTPEVNIRAEPDPVIDKRLVGWTAAGFGYDGGRVSDELRANWVVLNPNDGIDGQVLGIGESVNIFLLRDGFVVGEAITNADGSFTLESASEGPYTIFGYSPESIFAYSFLAIANDAGVVGQPLAINTLPVGGRQNTKLVSKLIAEYAPTVRFREYGIYDIGEEAADPPRYYGFAGFRTYTQPTQPATTIQHHQVAILNDGRFIGRLHAMHNRTGRPVEIRNSRVLIIQNGELLADTQVDNKGVFEIAGLPAGLYGLVAVGADGFGTLGLELANGGPSMPQTNNEYDPLFRQISSSSIRQAEPTRLDMAMINPDAMGWINAHVQEAAYFEAMNEPLPEMRDFSQMPYNYFGNQGNCGPGGYGGGYGGGGYGGQGGIGNWGGWIWPIALAWGISEASNSNNNFGVGGGGIRFVSPFNP